MTDNKIEIKFEAVQMQFLKKGIQELEKLNKKREKGTTGLIICGVLLVASMIGQIMSSHIVSNPSPTISVNEARGARNLGRQAVIKYLYATQQVKAPIRINYHELLNIENQLDSIYQAKKK